MRNYFLVPWVRGDLYDDLHNFVLTVYAPNGHGYSAATQFANFMATQNPLWTLEQSDAGAKYHLVSIGWVLSYLILSGPHSLVVSSFVWDTITASEKAIVGDVSPRDAQTWGYKSETHPSKKIDASGAAILLDFVSSLAVLAALLTKAARREQGAKRNELLRLASELLFIQKQVLTQAWTVVRAIEEYLKFEAEINAALGF